MCLALFSISDRAFLDVIDLYLHQVKLDTIPDVLESTQLYKFLLSLPARTIDVKDA